MSLIAIWQKNSRVPSIIGHFGTNKIINISGFALDRDNVLKTWVYYPLIKKI
jgi:hypothetical protein